MMDMPACPSLIPTKGGRPAGGSILDFVVDFMAWWVDDPGHGGPVMVALLPLPHDLPPSGAGSE